MHDTGTTILDIVMVIATVWIVKRFWGSFYEKKNNSILSVSIWIAFCIFQIISQWSSTNVDMRLTFINMLLLLVIVVCGYHCKGKEKYFLLIVFCGVWALVEMFVFFLLSEMQLETKSLSAIGMVISTLIMMILVYIVSTMWNKSNGKNIPGNFYLYLLFIPVGSIYISVTQFYFNNSKASSAMITSVLVLFNVIVFELYSKMNERFMYEKEKIVYAQQMEIISSNTIEQRKIMEDFHEEKHNLLNELVALKGGIEADDKETVIRNINKIINNCNYVETISNSGNTVVDAVINFKYAVAKGYGIEFDLKIFIPDELPIEQCDLGIVLGNAIDNAIEAVKGCKVREKIIEISMGVKKEAWVMVIKNPYEHKIIQDRTGKILSTKQEKNRHGYGLKSIKKIADEYQGEVVIDIEDYIFSLTIVLNVGEF